VHVGTLDQSYFLQNVGWVYGATLDGSRYGVAVTWLSDTHAEIRFKDARRYKIIESPVIIAGKSVTVSFADDSAP
jgi:SH3-like domain-containing protein